MRTYGRGSIRADLEVCSSCVKQERKVRSASANKNLLERGHILQGGSTVQYKLKEKNSLINIRFCAAILYFRLKIRFFKENIINHVFI